MITNVIQFFYPDIQKQEVKKFGLLALMLFFILGTYWILRLLKNVFIYQVTFPEILGWPRAYGAEFLPTLKIVSLFVVIGVIAIYTKLIDMFEKHKLFYVIISFYITCFAIITGIIGTAEIFGPETVGKWPLAGAGVFGYLLTESYGSLLISLFWSFTISSTKTDEAKRGFPLIIALTQIGTIGGSALVYFNLSNFTLLVLCMSFLGCVMASVATLIRSVPKEQMVSDKVEKKSKPDFFAGIKLLLTRPYLLGVLVVSTFYEVAKTIVDYQMNFLASFTLNTAQYKQFMGIYGMSGNALALIMALLGTSYLLKKMGLKFCLLLYPVMFGSLLIGLYLVHSSGVSDEVLLWTTFGVMMLVSATSYAVNNPTKDMMYIPTSKDAKFKAKGIVDMGGGRAAKGSASAINNTLKVAGQPASTIFNLMTYGTLISLGIIGVWIAVAIFVGNKNQQLIRDDQVIE